jgi:hypothetical protein
VEAVSILEGASLELQGAGLRLVLAKEALADFDADHAADAPVSPGLALSLAHQRDSLETEMDAARRRYADCLAQFIELQRVAR